MRTPSIMRDARGTTAIEFAILAPVIIVMICGAIEIGHFIAVRANLEAAVSDAARYAVVSQEVEEDERKDAMEARIEELMAGFPKPPGRELQVNTTVYRDFGSSYPENFQDDNGNGRYDPPSVDAEGKPVPGDTFTASDDRNNNGHWDPATPKEGTLGGPGDVVSYSATFPMALYFDFLPKVLSVGGDLSVTATTVMRNEPVRTRIS